MLLFARASASPRARLLALLPALASASWLMPACGTDAVGVDVCRRVETARCVEAPRCGIDLTRPAHAGGTPDDIDACTRYYDDACLHGLATSVLPSGAEVDRCVASIHAGSCDVVREPELACPWLVPPAADAGADVAVATDASSDAAAE